MHGLPNVLLLLETSLEYGRGILRGIVRYERLHGPWSLHVSPGHFEHEFPKAERHTLVKAARGLEKHIQLFSRISAWAESIFSSFHRSL